MLNIPADDAQAVSVVEAIHAGDVGGLRQLLNDNPALAHARIEDRRGVSRTLLHVVSDWPGHFPNVPQTVETLVAAGADVNAVVLHSISAETALHWAASSSDVGVLDALLDGGADIEAPGAVLRAVRRCQMQWCLPSDVPHDDYWNVVQTTIWQAAVLG